MIQSKRLWSIITMMVEEDRDVVAARQRARRIAQLLGFESLDRTRIATAVSEISRNAFKYAGGGRIEFSLDIDSSPYLFFIRISDSGPGIEQLDKVLDGTYRSSTGMGLGIIGASRLMDRFEIDSNTGADSGTIVLLGKFLPAGSREITLKELARINDEIMRERLEDPFDELQQQNRELIGVIDEVNSRLEELEWLNGELEDTNRGVVALSAELDEKAEHLRRADELKSRFFSNLSHEFRTPVNSILALSRLLLDRLDGELTGEQEKQIGFINKAAQELCEMVNDWLDLAKAESGKTVVRPTEFEVGNLFGALRGMFRPTLGDQGPSLIFEDPVSIPPLYTDEGKVSQILRNFISNALKFTAQGEVRVSATLSNDNETVIFSVADAGIGIAEEDQERIFQEFTQLENPIQKGVRGTGLGLPLAKGLAELLGGRVTVESEPGKGATFFAVIPMVYSNQTQAISEIYWRPDPTRFPVLIVAAEQERRSLYEKYLRGTGFQAVTAGSLQEARNLLSRLTPVAILFDREAGEEFSSERPIIISAEALDQGSLFGRLKEIVSEFPLEKILVIDDDEISRYLLTELLADTRYRVIEAAVGEEGLKRAREERPKYIILDLNIPDISGFRILDLLKSDPATRDIPVIINTAKILTESEREHLSAKAVAILSKDMASREAAITKIRQALIKAG